MKRIQPELFPVILAAFLAPVIGGQVSMDTLPLSEGYWVAAFGGPEAPLGARAVLGTLLAIGLGVALLRKHVVQVPNLAISGLLASLVILTGLSIMNSSFTYASLTAWPTWIIYALATFAAVGTSGRKVGVRALLWAIVLGTTVTALKGIQEFSALRATDPGHRIFADWNNPNAVAGIFCVTLPLTLGLCLSSERLESLGAGLCGALILFALALTQSKGGLLAVGLACAVFAGVALAWKAKSRVLRLAVPLGLGALLTFGTVMTSRSPGGAAPLDRVVNASSTQEQSAGFRTLLWKSSIDLIKAKPTGYGAGTFRYESARPARTEQTFHAHQTWLQLAVEASPLATMVLALLAAVWVFHLFVGARTWPWPENGLRAGVLASCVAAAAHGMVETNLVYVGVGVVTFIVIGLGLQLSSDGILPEFTPKKVRWGLVGLTVVVPVLIFWQGALGEMLKSGALAQAQSGNMVAARDALQLARSFAEIDGEIPYLLSRMEPTAEQRLPLLAKAASLSPSTKYLRAYARVAAELGRPADADKALERALQRDPTNLQTLEQQYLWQLAQNHKEEAIRTAEQLLAIEQTDVFRVRAIPELVPLETYDARVFLSGQTQDVARKASLLRPALEGYVKYMERTKPIIERMSAIDPSGSFLGHDKSEIEKVRVSGRELVKELKSLYGQSGDSASVSWVESVAPKFAD